MNDHREAEQLKFETGLRFADPSWDQMIAGKVNTRIHQKRTRSIRFMVALVLILGLGFGVYPLTDSGEQDLLQITEQWISPAPSGMFQQTIEEEIGHAGFF